MRGVIAYGSLMSAAGLELSGIRRVNAYPIIVSGFRRSFSQEPSWRKGVGNQRGVLTVAPTDQASMSAILITEITRTTLAILDERERGYDRVSVPKQSIRPFGGTDLGIEPSEVFIYVGKPHKINSELQPNVDYLTLCVNAAGEWGEAFLEAFQKTTSVSETPLAAYAETTGHR